MNTVVTTETNKQPAGKAAWILLAIAWIAFLLPIPFIGLFLGWPLNVVAFVLAIVAMAKGGASKGLWQLLASLIVSPIVYFIGVMLIFGIGAVAGTKPYDNYKERVRAQSPVSSAAMTDLGRND